MSGFVRELVAELRPLAAEFRRGVDAYAVLTITPTGDETGGWDEAEAVRESGECILVAGNLRPEERVIAERQGTITAYALRDLPWDTTLTARDVVRVGGEDGRRFEVIGVLRNEAANAAVTAICEERL